MHAMDFYTSTCRCVMQADLENPATLTELRRLLPCLRQALGCYVCFNLLKDPRGPDHNVCRHTVCTGCLGGKMKLKPACSWCKDYWEFVPNPLMKVLVTCYKKLCVYIYNSPLGQAVMNDNINGEVNHLLKIISEGMNFDDNYLPSQSCLKSEGQTDKPSCSTDTASTSTAIVAEDVDVMNVKEEIGEKQCPGSNESALPFVYSSKLSDKDISICSVSVNEVHKNKTSKRRCGKKKCGSGIASDHSYESSQNNSNKIVNAHTGFFKRGSFNKKTIKKVHRLKSSLSTRKKTNKKISKVKKFNTRYSKHEQPSELERIDNSVPPLKKVKVDLSPPELKPLSLCNCGKSGNFNQLTCIGQRCPCYSMKLPCIGCKCRGCRNPKKGPDYKGMGTIGNSAVLRSGTRNTSEFMCVNS